MASRLAAAAALMLATAAHACPFELRSARPPKPPPDAAPLAQAYLLVQSRLVRCAMTPRDVASARPFFADAGGHARFAASVARAAYADAYRDFVKAPAHKEVLHDYLARSLPRAAQRARERPEELALGFAWEWAYLAQAAINAYRHTDDVRFLRLVVPQFGEIMARRDLASGRIDETTGRPSRAWSSKVGDARNWKAVITHAGRITAPMAEFVELVRARPALTGPYGAEAQRLLGAIEEVAAEFEPDYRLLPGRQAGYYVTRGEGAVEPLNHVHAFGETLVLLHAVTRQEKYRKRITELAAFFAAAQFPQPNGTRVWGYRPTPDNLTRHAPEPIWKAQITVRFVLRGFAHGVGFGAPEVRNAAAVFLKNVSLADGKFNVTISAVRREPLDTLGSRASLGRGLAGWIYLDAVDPAVRGAIEEAVARDTRIFPRGWLQSGITAEAYSQRLAPVAAR